MCFSAEADLVAGLAVTAVGLEGVRHVRRRADVPLAALPLVLGAHLLVEVGVWGAREGRVPEAAGGTAEWGYLVIAFVVVPVLAPLALVAWEAPADRRSRLPFLVLGTAVAVLLLGLQLREPATVRVEAHHIEYVVRTGALSGAIAVAYVVATCGAALVSTDRLLRGFGWVNLAAVAVLAVVEREGLVSLWCAWAAVTSVVLVVRLRDPARPTRTAGGRGTPSVAGPDEGEGTRSCDTRPTTREEGPWRRTTDRA